jgi:hypothetical protein
VQKLAGSARGERHGGMGATNKTLWLAVAAAMVIPNKARARAVSNRSGAGTGPVQRQGRRHAARGPQNLARVMSPCGGHVVEVIAGRVFVDGRRIQTSEGSGSVYVVAPPTWRRDGRALAWVERNEGSLSTQLIVMPSVGGDAEPMPWTLPSISVDDQIFWAGPRRVVVGPALLVPRAVATWTESS